MNYEPKIIFNPTNEEIEFMYDRVPYIFAPGEKKLLDGEIAHHVLRYVNSKLKEYEADTDDINVTSSDVAYDKMPWGELLKLAGSRGISTVGKKKEEIIKLLIELDEEPEGT